MSVPLLEVHCRGRVGMSVVSATLVALERNLVDHSFCKYLLGGHYVLTYVRTPVRCWEYSSKQGSSGPCLLEAKSYDVIPFMSHPKYNLKYNLIYRYHLVF